MGCNGQLMQPTKCNCGFIWKRVKSTNYNFEKNMTMIFCFFWHPFVQTNPYHAENTQQAPRKQVQYGIEEHRRNN